MLKNNNNVIYNIFHNRTTFFILFSALVLFVSFFKNDFFISQNLYKMDQGDITWMIVASSLVLVILFVLIGFCNILFCRPYYYL